MTLDSLHAKIEQLLRKTNTHTVAVALSQLRHELTKPAGIFDSFAALAALENLVDVARENVDNNAHSYNTIYKQARPLQHHNQFQSLLLKLVSDKHEVEISKIIEKSLKASVSFTAAPPPWNTAIPPLRPYRPAFSSSQSRFGFRPRPYYRPPPLCYNCRGTGHFARACPMQR